MTSMGLSFGHDKKVMIAYRWTRRAPRHITPKRVALRVETYMRCSGWIVTTEVFKYARALKRDGGRRVWIQRDGYPATK